MRLNRVCALALPSAILFTASALRAEVHVYDFLLEGAQETPPVVTPATGACNVTLDDITFAVTVNCTFENLLGTANNAHIHGPAPIGVPAGVLFQLQFTPATSGTITGNGILTAEAAQHVLNGLTYVNLHSTFMSTGEIRGQIVPEPGSLALLAMSGALLLRRRRCRA